MNSIHPQREKWDSGNGNRLEPGRMGPRSPFHGMVAACPASSESQAAMPIAEISVFLERWHLAIAFHTVWTSEWKGQEYVLISDRPYLKRTQDMD
jgi:hypothetical protein